jgi:hypothetical protein
MFEMQKIGVLLNFNRYYFLHFLFIHTKNLLLPLKKNYFLKVKGERKFN